MGITTGVLARACAAQPLVPWLQGLLSWMRLRCARSIVRSHSSPGQMCGCPHSATACSCLLHCADHALMRIPVLSVSMRVLREKLTPELLQALRAVPGAHTAAWKFGALICDAPFDVGSEGTALIHMQLLFNNIFTILGSNSTAGFLPAIRYNGTSLRPDMLIIYGACTLLIGKSKAEGKLMEAVNDIKAFALGCLPAACYGAVPGIPAYAASGTTLQFLFIDKAGVVSLRWAGVAHQHLHHHKLFKNGFAPFLAPPLLPRCNQLGLESTSTHMWGACRPCSASSSAVSTQQLVSRAAVVIL